MLWLFKINDFWIFQKIIIFCRQSFLPLCRSQKCNSGFKYKGGSLIRLYRTFRPSAICQLIWNLSGRSFESFRDICPAIQDRLLVSFELCFTQGCGGIRGNFANHVINHKSFFMDPGNKAKSESSNCRRDTWNRELFSPMVKGDKIEYCHIILSLEFKYCLLEAVSERGRQQELSVSHSASFPKSCQIHKIPP